MKETILEIEGYLMLEQWLQVMLFVVSSFINGKDLMKRLNMLTAGKSGICSLLQRKEVFVFGSHHRGTI